MVGPQAGCLTEASGGLPDTEVSAGLAEASGGLAEALGGLAGASGGLAGASGVWLRPQRILCFTKINHLRWLVKTELKKIRQEPLERALKVVFFPRVIFVNLMKMSFIAFLKNEKKSSAKNEF